ncbi:hypothetical protein [uncultured Dubosiella sp.]|uniref:hypothetical protein n=1 Tax=uncultured Dubosiella sp. TaxID=1937011 RepID=UPI0025D7B1C6|nr:hypothetical protein [uncultured Dubosiella sp.]
MPVFFAASSAFLVSATAGFSARASAAFSAVFFAAALFVVVAAAFFAVFFGAGLVFVAAVSFAAFSSFFTAFAGSDAGFAVFLISAMLNLLTNAYNSKILYHLFSGFMAFFLILPKTSENRSFQVHSDRHISVIIVK